MSESTMTVSEYGDLEWRNEAGELHREGGLPAVVLCDGTVEFWEEGRRHRSGGLPAIVYPNGSEYHYTRGCLHRTGGLPAVVLCDGTEEYWEDGVCIPQDNSLSDSSLEHITVTTTHTITVPKVSLDEAVSEFLILNDGGEAVRTNPEYFRAGCELILYLFLDMELYEESLTILCTKILESPSLESRFYKDIQQEIIGY